MASMSIFSIESHRSVETIIHLCERETEIERVYGYSKSQAQIFFSSYFILTHWGRCNHMTEFNSNQDQSEHQTTVCSVVSLSH